MYLQNIGTLAKLWLKNALGTTPGKEAVRGRGQENDDVINNAGNSSIHFYYWHEIKKEGGPLPYQQDFI